MRRIAFILAALAAAAASTSAGVAATHGASAPALADGPLPCVVYQIYLDPNDPSEIVVCPPIEPS